jgi:hypothetical protein
MKTLRLPSWPTLGCVLLASLLFGCHAGTDNESRQITRTAAAVSATGGASAYYPVAQHIYVAYFGRPADPAGLEFFASRFMAIGAPQTVAGLSQAYVTNPDLKALVDVFGTSQESKDLYAGDNSAFMDAIYRNLFGRPADEAGKAFWVKQLDAGNITRASAAVTIMAGAQDSDLSIVENKVAAANVFSNTLDSDLRKASYSGMGPSASARALLATVTSGTAMDAFAANAQASINSMVDSFSNAAPTTAQSGGTVTLSNAYLSIKLDSSSGSILAVTDRVSGQELVKPVAGIRQAIWKIRSESASNGSAFADNNGAGAPQFAFINTGSESGVTITWQGINFDNGLKLPDAKASVKIALRQGDKLSHWSFEAHGLSNTTPTELHFPVMNSVAQLGSGGGDNRLLVPEQDGRLINDPIGTRAGFNRLYPSSFMTMQFEGYYNSRAGFYLGAQDNAGQTKTLSWQASAQDGRATWEAIHYFPAVSTSDLVLPYEANVGVFYGNWTAAADLYKGWARTQSWSVAAAAKHLPAWLRDTPYASYRCAHQCGDPAWESNYSTFATSQANNYARYGASNLAVLWGWEKMGSWFYGDYFAPSEGWEGFDKLVQTMHGSKNYLQVFISGIYLDAATPLWADPQAQAGAARDQQGQPIVVKNQVGNILHSWNTMNPVSPLWQNNLSTAVSTLASHGVDSVQFDNWPFYDIADDFSSGHPPGKGGTWQWEAWYKAISMAEKAGRDVKADLAFSTEGIHELALPLVDVYDDRDAMAETMSYSRTGAVVPAFGYVYKPLVQGMSEYWGNMTAGLEDSYHRLALSRSLIWGEMPRLPNNPWPDDPKFSKPLMDYFIAIGKVRTQFRQFLIDGEMVAVAPVASASTPVNIGADGGMGVAYSGSADAIQSTGWRSSAGNGAIVMTNIGPGQLSFGVTIDPGKLGLAAGASYTATLVVGSDSRSLGTVRTGTQLNVTLQPLQIGVITLNH